NGSPTAARPAETLLGPSCGPGVEGGGGGPSAGAGASAGPEAVDRPRSVRAMVASLAAEGGRASGYPELVQTLRQCDGTRVQCVVLVRDDFWMVATRFMRQLEVRLVEGHNSASVDLFDPDHARKVLAAFGRAFGRLAETGNEMGREQKEFLKQAVTDLAQESKVIPVRLAVFAERMKGKPWTLASLKAVGGTEGVGVTFLEETFS